MPLDIQARTLLDAAKAAGVPEMWELTPSGRKRMELHV